MDESLDLFSTPARMVEGQRLIGLDEDDPPPDTTQLDSKDATCCITDLSGNIAAMTFNEAQWAVTPGQSAVLYDGEVCLGGGVIASVSALDSAM